MMLGLRFEDDTSETLEITEIRVTGSTGSVEVRPSSAPGVGIHRTVHYFKPFQRRPGATHRIDGTVLHVDTNLGTFFPFFVAVDYVIDAPAGVRVSGRLSSGSLRLTGVSTVDVKTSSGSVALVGATGDVTAKTSSGSITGRELMSTNVGVSVSSGRISLDLAEPGEVRAHASSGAIKVTVPDGRYRIDTKVSSGRTRVEVPSDPASPHHLDLRATSGTITVAKR